MSLVGVVIGSNSDEEISQQVSKVLEDLGITHEVSVISAHRTPEKAREYAQTAASRGLEIIIAAAGGSAALPGVMASILSLKHDHIKIKYTEYRDKLASS